MAPWTYTTLPHPDKSPTETTPVVADRFGAGSIRAARIRNHGCPIRGRLIFTAPTRSGVAPCKGLEFCMH